MIDGNANGVDGEEGEIKRLIDGLVKRGMRERADAVSNAAQDVVSKCQEAVAEMYPKAPEGEVGQGLVDGGEVGVGAGFGGVNGGALGEGMLRPQGGDATLWDSMQEVSRKRDPPVVKAFERLSLLG